MLATGVRVFLGVLAGALMFACAFAFDRESITGGKDLSSFQSVYIAPVGLALTSDRDARPVRSSDATEKASDFHEALVDAFSDDFEIASGSGEGVLTIEATLTRLSASRPTFADVQNDPSLSHESVYAGGGAFEAQLSENGALLGEFGDDYVGNLGDHGLRVGIWQDVDHAFWRWSQQLKKFVERN